MAEAIGHMLIIFANPLSYTVGKFLISMLTLGKLSIEPLPKKYPAHFVQAFDDEKVIKAEDNEHFSVSHEKALLVGYFVILCVFSALLYIFRDFFIAPKIAG